MTITIEMDGQRIEADDIASAEKAMRKAKREQDKAERARQTSRAIAGRRALESAMILADGACQINKGHGRSWTWGRPDRRVYPAQVYGQCVSYDQDANRMTLKATTKDGNGETWFSQYGGYNIACVVENGAGYIIGVKTTDQDSSNYWCGVGVCDGELTLYPLPEAIGDMVDSAEAICDRKHEEIMTKQAS
jgi:hypothetical protein